MSTKYSKYVSTKVTPQTEVIPGREKDMVKNSAGGYSFSVDKWTALNRFLILGSEGGSYYASEKKLTKTNAKNIIDCIKEDDIRVLNTVVEISDSGRAPKNDPAIFVLALVFTYGTNKGKAEAKKALPKICRIGTHLFHFAEMVNDLRGWGRGLRTSIANWYLDKNLRDLALQVVKYQQRDGWSHDDLLRLSHPKTNDTLRNNIFNWITQPAICNNCKSKMTWDTSSKSFTCEACKGTEVASASNYSMFQGTDANIIWAMEEAKTAGKKKIIELISNYNLPAECIPTQFKTDPDILRAMLPNQPMTNLIRNLGNLSKNGVLVPGAFDDINLVVDKITNAEVLAKSRIHPLSILVALKTYESGTGYRGSGSWNPVSAVVDALNDAFYKSFGNVVPTNKKYMLALDVSGSMTYPDIAGMPGISPRVGSAAMALVTQAVEKNTLVVGFHSNSGRSHYSIANGTDGITPIDISRYTRLDNVINKISGLPFGGTDCALPMLYALKNNIDIDTFVVYTDNETWAGSIQPVQALRQYRNAINPNAKLVVVGMVSNGFTIADPTDSGMLDCVGFDTATPNIISSFTNGDF